MFYIKDDQNNKVAVKGIVAKDEFSYICEVSKEEGCVSGWWSNQYCKLCWGITKKTFDVQFVMEVE